MTHILQSRWFASRRDFFVPGRGNLGARYWLAISWENTMDRMQTRAAIVIFLDSALKLAEEIDDGATTYLIEHALDEARSQSFSGVPHVDPTH
jgi:hypothetical protein